MAHLNLVEQTQGHFGQFGQLPPYLSSHVNWRDLMEIITNVDPTESNKAFIRALLKRACEEWPHRFVA